MRERLTIESVDDLHPLRLALLNTLHFEGVLPIDECGCPLVDTVFAPETVKFVIDVRAGYFLVGLFVAV